MSIPLTKALPEFAGGLQRALELQGEPELAAQIPVLHIVGRCTCHERFCSSFYVQPPPKGSYGPNHRTVRLDHIRGMVLFDVVGEKIAHVEVLGRGDIRAKLRELFP